MDDSSDLDEFEEKDDILFQQASEYVQQQSSKQGGVQLDQKKLLELYGFYKTATVGKCKDPKPGLFDLRGKAKWSAWMQVSNLGTDEAKTKYIQCVKEFYNWSPLLAAVRKEKPAGCGGNSVSTMLKPEENTEEEDTIFTWAKDSSLNSIQSWLKEGNDPNVKDEEGLTPLHWAVDRGHMDACILLMNSGANLTIKDNEGQTPLNYAEICEHSQIVSLIEHRLSQELIFDD